MGSGAARFSAVALDTDVTLGMAGLARLQVPARFGGMLTYCKGILLTARTKHQMRLDAHIASGEAAVAGVAE